MPYNIVKQLSDNFSAMVFLKSLSVIFALFALLFLATFGPATAGPTHHGNCLERCYDKAEDVHKECQHKCSHHHPPWNQRQLDNCDHACAGEYFQAKEKCLNEC